MTGLVAVWRLLRLLGHVWAGRRTLGSAWAGLTVAEREATVQRWSAGALRILGVAWQVGGAPPQTGPALVVCNHLSWLDILVLNAVRPCRFVSKSDVRDWPLLGPLVAASGTVFIERAKRRDAMRVVHDMAERLQTGDLLAVFPEGTTGDGQAVLPFHANLLQAAVVTDTPVWPLALAYRHSATGLPHQAPVYVGDTTLLASVWRTVCAKDLVAHVWCGLPDTAQGRDRRTWSDALRQDVARLLDRPLTD